MIKDNRTFFLAFLTFILPLLGLPLWWRFFFIMLFALILMISALDWKHIRSSNIFSRDMSHTSSISEHTSTDAPTEKPKRTIYKSRKKPKPMTDILPEEKNDISF